MDRPSLEHPKKCHLIFERSLMALGGGAQLDWQDPSIHIFQIKAFDCSKENKIHVIGACDVWPTLWRLYSYELEGQSGFSTVWPPSLNCQLQCFLWPPPASALCSPSSWPWQTSAAACHINQFSPGCQDDTSFCSLCPMGEKKQCQKSVIYTI